MLLALLIGLGPLSLRAKAQEHEPLPETREKVVDLFGNEARLYFIPGGENIMVFVDPGRDISRAITLGANERNSLMTAYMKACDRINAVKEGEAEEAVSVDLRGAPVVFKAARREKRAWVVLYVGDRDAPARFAVPQAWELKDPKLEQLYGIKSGFERLLLKSAL